MNSRGLANAAMVTAIVFSASIGRAQFWPSVHERAASALASEDVEQRRLAAGKLLEMPRSIAEQLLPRALGDSDAEVRLLAGVAVLEHPIDGAIPLAIQWLSDGDARVRTLAAQMLTRLRPEARAVAPLARVLSDPSPVARKHAARALARIGSADAARVLLNHLDDPNEEFQLEVIQALAAIGDEAAVLPLVAKVQDTRTSVRRAAIRAIPHLEGSGRASGALVLALSDSDPEVRIAAMRVLGELGALEAVDPLVDLVERDRDVDVRVAALNALLRLPSPRGVRVAVGLLNHPRQELRSEALARLAEIGPRAESALLQCVAGGSGVEDVQGCALALGRSGVSTAAAAIVEAYRAGRLSVIAALPALASTRDSVALPVALEALGTDPLSVRRAAIDALWHLLDPRRPDGRAVEPLAEALRQARTSDEAALLLPLLGRTGSHRAVPHLVPYLRVDFPLVLRLAATRGLGSIKGAYVEPQHVVAGLTATSSELRWETSMAAREGEWRGVAEVLVDLLSTARASEVFGLATALWGPAVHIRKPHVAQRMLTLIERAAPKEQAVLLEAYARLPWELTDATFARWVRSSDPPDAAKVAEVLAQKKQAVPLLLSKLSERRPEVLANAVWALRQYAPASARARLRSLTEHAEVSVAANAVATLSRSDAVEHSLLCGLLADQRAPVLVNVLAGLHLNEVRCGDGERERQLLLTHASPFVRQRAAVLLHRVPSERAKADERALAQCLRYDIDGEVASRCAVAETGDEMSAVGPLTVLVVPAASSNAMPLQSFALQHQDGFVRLGWADHRGGAYDFGASDSVRLLPPSGAW